MEGTVKLLSNPDDLKNHHDSTTTSVFERGRGVVL